MKKKVVLITGASRGIGRATAQYLAENQYQVIANYNHSEKEAKDLKKQLQDKGIEIAIIQADVSERNQVKKMISEIVRFYNRIDVLINNAGIDQEKIFQDITDEEWEQIVKNNLYSVFCTSQEVVKEMIAQQEGCIINISSIYGVKGGSGATAYSATKAAIDGITKSLAKELGPSNIRVNSIAPGVIDTDMNRFLSEKDKEEIKKESSLEKIGQGLDVAKCIKWLIEDEFTTGQIISIDGGWKA